MTRPLLIGLDIDGICADLHTPWLAWYNARWSDSITLADITIWGMHQLVRPECGRRIYDFLSDPDLYERVAPHAGAVAAVDALRRDGHDLVAVTWNYDENTLPGKIRWVEQHLQLGRANIITTERKELVCLDVLVEDAPHNLQRYRERWGSRPLLVGISWPYNQVARTYANLLAEGYADTEAAWRQLLACLRQHAQGQP